MRVTVVGGGIAGLTCALSLHAAGFEPRVCEAARTIEAVGVGINLLGMATHYRKLAQATVAQVNTRPSWTVPRRPGIGSVTP
ncbi:NAD(P)-binding protein [Streptomyces sp. P9(2023)]|uniref:NAD(P)-binding protein n=1 Tax=Streptomyces sp. P9(2023) TaxID=3064394 RepID=UPI0037DCC97F